MNRSSRFRRRTIVGVCGSLSLGSLLMVGCLGGSRTNLTHFWDKDDVKTSSDDAAKTSSTKGTDPAAASAKSTDSKDGKTVTAGRFTLKDSTSQFTSAAHPYVPKKTTPSVVALPDPAQIALGTKESAAPSGATLGSAPAGAIPASGIQGSAIPGSVVPASATAAAKTPAQPVSYLSTEPQSPPAQAVPHPPVNSDRDSHGPDTTQYDSMAPDDFDLFTRRTPATFHVAEAPARQAEAAPTAATSKVTNPFAGLTDDAGDETPETAVAAVKQPAKPATRVASNTVDTLPHPAPNSASEPKPAIAHPAPTTSSVALKAVPLKPAISPMPKTAAAVIAAAVERVDDGDTDEETAGVSASRNHAHRSERSIAPQVADSHAAKAPSVAADAPKPATPVELKPVTSNFVVQKPPALKEAKIPPKPAAKPIPVVLAAEETMLATPVRHSRVHPLADDDSVVEESVPANPHEVETVAETAAPATPPISLAAHSTSHSDVAVVVPEKELVVHDKEAAAEPPSSLPANTASSEIPCSTGAMICESKSIRGRFTGADLVGGGAMYPSTINNGRMSVDAAPREFVPATVPAKACLSQPCGKECAESSVRQDRVNVVNAIARDGANVQFDDIPDSSRRKTVSRAAMTTGAAMTAGDWEQPADAEAAKPAHVSHPEPDAMPAASPAVEESEAPEPPRSEVHASSNSQFGVGLAIGLAASVGFWWISRRGPQQVAG